MSFGVHFSGKEPQILAEEGGTPPIVIWQCSQTDCAFRFPDSSQLLASGKKRPCPLCGGELLDTGTRSQNYPPAPQPYPSRFPLSLLLDNVRSAYNVGSIFRTADSARVQQLYLCGMTPNPTHKGVGKTALGAEQTIAWQAFPNAVQVAELLLAQGQALWAVECTPTAQSVFAMPAPTRPTVLVLGNEVAGVDPDLLARCERTVYVPMWGQKESLNITVATGIALFALLFAKSAVTQSV
ncbi:MAG TPA: TrmH family RNA methyltransferase [Anaerolineales bacterium]|nr:TrmH family RNA methyltransferase [Anaerolineales bacterium]